jgi:uncharacterized membrane protein YadS
MGGLLPGVLLAAALAWAGALLADWVGKTAIPWLITAGSALAGGDYALRFERSPISAILMTILLGLVLRNVAGLPKLYEEGLRFSVKRILRFGIALLGLRLSLVAVGEIGLSALPVVVGTITGALILVTWLGRTLGLPARLGSLIAVGTSICGASAIVATGPAIDAEEDEVSYAVACITLFGMIALFSYPFLGHWMFAGKPQPVGLFLGTAIHETAQVAGAGLMYEQQFGRPEDLPLPAGVAAERDGLAPETAATAEREDLTLKAAMTTKLVRNLSMGIVIPLMAVLYHRRRERGAGAKKKSGRFAWAKYVPGFVVAFVLLAAVRSLGDLGGPDGPAFGLFDRSVWEAFLGGAKGLSVWCLTVAMAAVGLGTSITQLKVLGWKPLCVGLAAALLVGVISVSLIAVIATFV